MEYRAATSIRSKLNEFLFEFRDCIKTRPSRNNLRCYVNGQLSELPRKSVEPIALDAGVHHRTLQEFLSYGRWDHEGVRMRVQEIVRREKGCTEGIVVVDETTFPKKGTKTAGVKRQHCGATGKIDNCVASVHLGYVCGDFRALIDSDLYIPADWMEDAERRREARIPEELVFRTKLEIAIDEIKRTQANGFNFKWVVADELYGRSGKFRRELEESGLYYVVEVPCDLTGWTKLPSLEESKRQRKDSNEKPKLHLAPGAPKPRRVDSLWERGGPSWQNFRVKDTQKGPEVWNVRCTRFYPWEKGLPGNPVTLIIADNVLTADRKHFLANVSPETPLKNVLHVAFSRWNIERLFEDCKGEVGMDHFEVRNYISITRHLIISMVSILFLVLETDRLKKKSRNNYLSGPGYLESTA